MATGVIRVVVADDHPAMREGVRSTLEKGAFSVVAQAGDAASTIAAVERCSPDLVLCDLRMPGGGLAVVTACAPKCKVVMLTVSEEEADLLQAVAAGAYGYLLKTVGGEDLRRALRRVMDGEPVFTPTLAGLVLTEYRRLAGLHKPDTPLLTPREREVLRSVATGATYREIAGELFIAEKTVENHVSNLLSKLQLHRRAELTRYALDHGIG